MAYYDDLADLGWSEERIIADYEREHGPAVAWIMRLYFEFQRLGFYDMIEGIPTLMRDLHARGVRLWGLTNFTVRGVREMHGKYPWLGLLGGTVISAQEGVAKPDLHARGVRLWGLTNFTVRGVREMHGKYPWLGLLGGTVISAQEGVAKPDPFPSRSRADVVRG